MSDYLNTFAIISFKFDNPIDTLKYEYFKENEISNHPSLSARQLLGSNANDEYVIDTLINRRAIENSNEQLDLKPLYWVFKDGTTVNIRMTYEYLSDDEFQNVFARPI